MVQSGDPASPSPADNRRSRGRYRRPECIGADPEQRGTLRRYRRRIRIIGAVIIVKTPRDPRTLGAKPLGGKPGRGLFICLVKGRTATQVSRIAMISMVSSRPTHQDSASSAIMRPLVFNLRIFSGMSIALRLGSGVVWRAQGGATGALASRRTLHAIELDALYALNQREVQSAGFRQAARSAPSRKNSR